MRKEVIPCFLGVVILLGACAVLAEETGKINEAVYEKLNETKETKVIIEVAEGNSLQMSERNIMNVENELEKPIVRSENFIVANISAEELSVLNKSKFVERIDPSLRLYASLQDSKEVVNAKNASMARINGINLTGIGETVCIIDSGIDFSHPSLIGKNKTCVIDCYEKSCVEDCGLGDDNGHGTHVAGIAASEAGIAPGMALIGLKILNSAGASSDSGAVDLKNAVDWCVVNSAAYNISVISMSLGTSETYSSNCDESYWSSLTSSINEAIGKNISVVASTGNSNTNRKTNAIVAPACIENVTSVSATNKDDSISSYGHYSNFTDFFAPGTSINSTYNTGGYATASGTSMSAPHASAAFALIKQFYRLQNSSVMTPWNIERNLKTKGKNITTVPGFNISRIDIFDTMIYLDGIKPSVGLVMPLNNAWNLDGNVTFRCNATDLYFKNATFYLWNSTSLYNTSSGNTTGGYHLLEINQSNLPVDYYKWNCLFQDENRNSGFASANFSLNVWGVNVELESPSSIAYIKNNFSNFSCRAQSEVRYSLKNVTFYLWNASTLKYNETRNATGWDNTTIFNYSLGDEGNYHWNCLAYNNASNYSWAESNRSLEYDLSLPSVNLSFPAEGYSATTGVFSFGFNVSDRIGVANCSLVLDGAIVATNLTISNNTANTLAYEISVGSHIWSVNCSDLAGNVGNSSLRSVSSTPAPQVVSTGGGGGGGGGGSSQMTFYASESDMGSSYKKELSKSEGISFTLGAKKERHEITVREIKENYAVFVIQSEPINVTLYIGQETKLNLTSDKYYDLYIKLEGARNSKVNVTIKEISEIIPVQPPAGLLYAHNESENMTGFGHNEMRKEFLTERKMIIILGAGFAIFVGIFIGILIEHRKSKVYNRKKGV